jgi:hypothetical protein
MRQCRAIVFGLLSLTVPAVPPLAVLLTATTAAAAAAAIVAISAVTASTAIVDFLLLVVGPVHRVRRRHQHRGTLCGTFAAVSASPVGAGKINARDVQYQYLVLCHCIYRRARESDEIYTYLPTYLRLYNNILYRIVECGKPINRIAVEPRAISMVIY